MDERSLYEIARRALEARVNREPVFVTHHEYWLLKNVMADHLEEWEAAVHFASRDTGIGLTGKPVKVKVVDKLPERV